MSRIFLVQVAGNTLVLDNQVIRLAVGSGFDSTADIALNSTHRQGDGSDHADVALNSTHRGRSDNPHAVTKTQVGLSDVTDDAQLKRSAADFQAFTLKGAPVLADSILGEDSSDGNNKKLFTLSGVLATFKAAFDLVYQPISTALSKITESGGLPLWDGGAWPGGGGGADPEWETIETRVMTGNAVELFDVGTDNVIRFLCENILLLDTGAVIQMGLSNDGGSSYASKHNGSLVSTSSAAATPAGQADSAGTFFRLGPAGTNRTKGNYALVEIHDVAVATRTYLPEWKGLNAGAFSTSIQWSGGGSHHVDAVVNKVKIFPSNATMTGGTIILQKRTF